MGYLTNYKINIHPYSEEVYNTFLDEDFTGFIEDDSCKWYSCIEDTQKISSMFPGYLIDIIGEGEEAGDIWRSVFFNGEVVWEWHLDSTIPEIPESILNLLNE
jgi:hypothetical protein